MSVGSAGGKRHALGRVCECVPACSSLDERPSDEEMDKGEKMRSISFLANEMEPSDWMKRQGGYTRSGSNCGKVWAPVGDKWKNGVLRA